MARVASAVPEALRRQVVRPQGEPQVALLTLEVLKQGMLGPPVLRVQRVYPPLRLLVAVCPRARWAFSGVQISCCLKRPHESQIKLAAKHSDAVFSNTYGTSMQRIVMKLGIENGKKFA